MKKDEESSFPTLRGWVSPSILPLGSNHYGTYSTSSFDRRPINSNVDRLSKNPVLTMSSRCSRAVSSPPRGELVDPVVVNAGFTFRLTEPKGATYVHNHIHVDPASTVPQTASSYLSKEIDRFLKKSDHSLDRYEKLLKGKTPPPRRISSAEKVASLTKDKTQREISPYTKAPPKPPRLFQLQKSGPSEIKFTPSNESDERNSVPQERPCTKYANPAVAEQAERQRQILSRVLKSRGAGTTEGEGKKNSNLEESSGVRKDSISSSSSLSLTSSSDDLDGTFEEAVVIMNGDLRQVKSDDTSAEISKLEDLSSGSDEEFFDVHPLPGYFHIPGRQQIKPAGLINAPLMPIGTLSGSSIPNRFPLHSYSLPAVNKLHPSTRMGNKQPVDNVSSQGGRGYKKYPAPLPPVSREASLLSLSSETNRSSLDESVLNISMDSSSFNGDSGSGAIRNKLRRNLSVKKYPAPQPPMPGDSQNLVFTSIKQESVVDVDKSESKVEGNKRDSKSNSFAKSSPDANKNLGNKRPGSPVPFRSALFSLGKSSSSSVFNGNFENSTSPKIRGYHERLDKPLNTITSGSNLKSSTKSDSKSKDLKVDSSSLTSNSISSTLSKQSVNGDQNNNANLSSSQLGCNTNESLSSNYADSSVTTSSDKFGSVNSTICCDSSLAEDSRASDISKTSNSISSSSMPSSFNVTSRVCDTTDPSHVDDSSGKKYDIKIKKKAGTSQQTLNSFPIVPKGKGSKLTEESTDKKESDKISSKDGKLCDKNKCSNIEQQSSKPSETAIVNHTQKDITMDDPKQPIAAPEVEKDSTLHEPKQPETTSNVTSRDIIQLSEKSEVAPNNVINPVTQDSKQPEETKDLSDLNEKPKETFEIATSNVKSNSVTEDLKQTETAATDSKGDFTSQDKTTKKVKKKKKLSGDKNTTVKDSGDDRSSRGSSVTSSRGVTPDRGLRPAPRKSISGKLAALTNKFEVENVEKGLNNPIKKTSGLGGGGGGIFNSDKMEPKGKSVGKLSNPYSKPFSPESNLSDRKSSIRGIDISIFGSLGKPKKPMKKDVDIIKVKDEKLVNHKDKDDKKGITNNKKDMEKTGKENETKVEDETRKEANEDNKEGMEVTTNTGKEIESSKKDTTILKDKETKHDANFKAEVDEKENNKHNEITSKEGIGKSGEESLDLTQNNSVHEVVINEEKKIEENNEECSVNIAERGLLNKENGEVIQEHFGSDQNEPLDKEEKLENKDPTIIISEEVERMESSKLSTEENTEGFKITKKEDSGSEIPTSEVNEIPVIGSDEATVIKEGADENPGVSISEIVNSKETSPMLVREVIETDLKDELKVDGEIERTDTCVLSAEENIEVKIVNKENMNIDSGAKSWEVNEIPGADPDQALVAEEGIDESSGVKISEIDSSKEISKMSPKEGIEIEDGLNVVDREDSKTTDSRGTSVVLDQNLLGEGVVQQVNLIDNILESDINSSNELNKVEQFIIPIPTENESGPPTSSLEILTPQVGKLETVKESSGMQSENSCDTSGISISESPAIEIEGITVSPSTSKSGEIQELIDPRNPEIIPLEIVNSDSILPLPKRPEELELSSSLQIQSPSDPLSIESSISENLPDTFFHRSVALTPIPEISLPGSPVLPKSEVLISNTTNDTIEPSGNYLKHNSSTSIKDENFSGSNLINENYSALPKVSSDGFNNEMLSSAELFGKCEDSCSTGSFGTPRSDRASSDEMFVNYEKKISHEISHNNIESCISSNTSAAGDSEATPLTIPYVKQFIDMSRSPSEMIHPSNWIPQKPTSLLQKVSDLFQTLVSKDSKVNQISTPPVIDVTLDQVPADTARTYIKGNLDTEKWNIDVNAQTNPYGNSAISLSPTNVNELTQIPQQEKISIIKGSSYQPQISVRPKIRRTTRGSSIPAEVLNVSEILREADERLSRALSKSASTPDSVMKQFTPDSPTYTIANTYDPSRFDTLMPLPNADEINLGDRPRARSITPFMDRIERSPTPRRVMEETEALLTETDRILKKTRSQQSLRMSFAKSLSGANLNRLTEVTADLSEEHSTAQLASERIEAEQSERMRLEKEVAQLQTEVKRMTSLNGKLEMEKLTLRNEVLQHAEVNGDVIGEDEISAGGSDASLYKRKYEWAMREIEVLKKHLKQQQEDDLDQLLVLKKQLEKKVTDAYEETDEQRQVVAQMKKKSQRLQAEMNDMKILLEEQTSRNNLLEKKQRKFDQEMQSVAEEERNERLAKEKVQRERDQILSEKYSFEQEVSTLKLELELKDEKIASLTRELSDLNFTGKTEEEVALLKKTKHDLELKVKDQEEELDDLAGQVQMLEAARVRLEMSIEQMRKENRRELSQRDEEMEEVRVSAQKKIKALEAQLESEHDERTALVREKHDLERRLVDAHSRSFTSVDEEAFHRVKKELKKTKALLKDTQTMLEKTQSEGSNKLLLRQLKTQLEDAEFAKNAAIKARQSTEADFTELQNQIEEALRAKKDTEDKLARITKEKAEVQTQLEESEEEVAEVMKKYKATVSQLSVDQVNISEQAQLIADLEHDKQVLQDKLTELSSKVEVLEGETANIHTQRRLQMKIKELESKHDLELTTRQRLESQITRLKDQVERVSSECDAIRMKEMQAVDHGKKVSRQLREAKEDSSSLQQKLTDAISRKQEVEKQYELAESEIMTLKSDLKLAFKRIEDLQQALQGDLSDSDTELSESGGSESDLSLTSFLTASASTSHSSERVTSTVTATAAPAVPANTEPVFQETSLTGNDSDDSKHDSTSLDLRIRDALVSGSSLMAAIREEDGKESYA